MNEIQKTSYSFLFDKQLMLFLKNDEMKIEKDYKYLRKKEFISDENRYK